MAHSWEFVLNLQKDFGLDHFNNVGSVKILDSLGHRLNAFCIAGWVWIFWSTSKSFWRGKILQLDLKYFPYMAHMFGRWLCHEALYSSVGSSHHFCNGMCCWEVVCGWRWLTGAMTWKGDPHPWLIMPPFSFTSLCLPSICLCLSAAVANCVHLLLPCLYTPFLPATGTTFYSKEIERQKGTRPEQAQNWAVGTNPVVPWVAPWKSCGEKTTPTAITSCSQLTVD